MKELLDRVRAIGPKINQSISEERLNRRLSPEVMTALKDAHLHRLFMPKSLQGLELDPLSAAKLVEEVARYNTAAGWSMMVGNVSTWWCSRLPDEGIEELYADGPEAIIAGAFHPPMMATPTKDGYRINGRSPLASNVSEARWIFVTAMITENGQPKFTNGIPEIVGVFMDARDCQVIDTWDSIGMRATDSNDVAAKEVFVPQHRSFFLMPEYQPNSYYQGDLYRFAAVGAGVACLIAPVSLAIARNAVEEVKELAQKKTAFASMVSLRERGVTQRKIGMAEAMVQSGRAYLHHTIDRTWSKVLDGQTLSLADRADILLAATHVNQTCVQAIDLMYSCAGTSGIYLKNKLANYFTDSQVIRQHGFANESRYETAGQVLLGLNADLPVLAF